MSLVTVETSTFPIVHISLKGNFTGEDAALDTLFTEWDRLYERQIPFTLVFDTLGIENVPVSYCVRMAMFIRKVKSKSRVLLKKTIVVLNSDFVAGLLRMILSIQKPICPVALINTNDVCDIKTVLTDMLCDRPRTDVKTIVPEDDTADGGIGERLSRYLFGTNAASSADEMPDSNVTNTAQYPEQPSST